MISRNVGTTCSTCSVLCNCYLRSNDTERTNVFGDHANN